MSRYEVDVVLTVTYKVPVDAETPAEAETLAEGQVRHGKVAAASSVMRSDVAQVFELRKRFP